MCNLGHIFWATWKRLDNVKIRPVISGRIISLFYLIEDLPSR